MRVPKVVNQCSSGGWWVVGWYQSSRAAIGCGWWMIGIEHRGAIQADAGAH